MYTNPSNITKTLIALLERNATAINNLIRVYEGNRSLTVLEGERPTLPIDMYPSFEIEPTNSDNSWATTRSQRPTYNFNCILTVKVSNLKYGVEYICSLASLITEIMTSPNNLQLKVVNETRWDANSGLIDT